MEPDKKLTIKDWAIDDRPREKMMLKGIGSLSNAELIAILFGTGTRNESAVELARKLLDTAGNNLNELARMSLKDLCKVKGIGEAKAISIITALELGKRRNIEEVERQKIQSSKDIYNLMAPKIADLPHEEFWVILLNRANMVNDKVKISQGGISGTVTDVRIILKLALENFSSSIILVHNHPSGNNKPSQADVDITKKIKDAGNLMEITVLDHIIVCTGSYYSFADEGCL